MLYSFPGEEWWGGGGGGRINLVPRAFPRANFNEARSGPRETSGTKGNIKRVFYFGTYQFRVTPQNRVEPLKTDTYNGLTPPLSGNSIAVPVAYAADARRRKVKGIRAKREKRARRVT